MSDWYKIIISGFIQTLHWSCCTSYHPSSHPLWNHLLSSLYTLFPPKISTFWKVKFPVCHFCLLLLYFPVALRIQLRKTLWRWGREGSKALCRMAMPHKATILPLAFENQICQQVDQVGNSRCTLWIWNMSLQKNLEVYKVSIHKGSFSHLPWISGLARGQDQVLHSASSERGPFPRCWLSPQCQGTLAHVHRQLLFLGDKLRR